MNILESVCYRKISKKFFLISQSSKSIQKSNQFRILYGFIKPLLSLITISFTSQSIFLKYFFFHFSGVLISLFFLKLAGVFLYLGFFQNFLPKICHYCLRWIFQETPLSHSSSKFVKILTFLKRISCLSLTKFLLIILNLF